MTKDEAVKYHREMWKDIADEIERGRKQLDIDILKVRWCVEHHRNPSSYCFACEYCDYNYGSYCERGCLFNWGEGPDFVHCTDGYYKKCRSAETWREQAELARKIASLPVREDV